MIIRTSRESDVAGLRYTAYLCRKQFPWPISSSVFMTFCREPILVFAESYSKVVFIGGGCGMSSCSFWFFDILFSGTIYTRTSPNRLVMVVTSIAQFREVVRLENIKEYAVPLVSQFWL